MPNIETQPISPLRLSVMPGDGIGPELVASAVAVLEAASAAKGTAVEMTEEPGVYPLPPNS